MGRRAKGEAPCVRVDRSSGCGRVIIGGKTHWLGRCPDGKPTAEQQARAARLWHEHLSGHHAEPAPRPIVQESPATIQPPSTPTGIEASGITIAALGLRWLDHCESYYRDRDGNTTSSVDGARMALRCLFPFGDVAAAAFTPRDLTVVRDAMIRDGRPRVTCNSVTKTIRRMFKWGVCEGLVPPAVWHALSAVEALRKGRTEARELPPVKEVPESVVEATLPYLPPIVAAMVWLQRWMGSRPDEVCILRPCDVDRSGDVWVFTPRHHKLDWRDDGKPRRIAIGAEGQKVLMPYLLRAADSYCFSPIESEQARSRERRAERRSPLTPSQRNRRPQKNGRRRPKDRYTNDSYRRAIQRAVEIANRERSKAGLEPLPRWSPNQLRHLRSGELQEKIGIEAANAVLGHANIRTTEIYAKRKLALAIDATRRLG